MCDSKSFNRFVVGNMGMAVIQLFHISLNHCRVVIKHETAAFSFSDESIPQNLG
jgi:hypothetical protein